MGEHETFVTFVPVTTKCPYLDHALLSPKDPRISKMLQVHYIRRMMAGETVLH